MINLLYVCMNNIFLVKNNYLLENNSENNVIHLFFLVWMSFVSGLREKSWSLICAFSLNLLQYPISDSIWNTLLCTHRRIILKMASNILGLLEKQLRPCWSLKRSSKSSTGPQTTLQDHLPWARLTWGMLGLDPSGVSNEYARYLKRYSYSPLWFLGTPVIPYPLWPLGIVSCFPVMFLSQQCCSLLVFVEFHPMHVQNTPCRLMEFFCRIAPSST